MTAAVHFTMGGISVITAADRTVPRNKGSWCRQGIEQVVESGDVIGQDFNDRGHGEHYQRRRGPEPGEIVAQREITGIGSPAHNEHRQKHAETGSSRKPNAENN